MTTAIQLPEGAPEEVITHALVRDVDLSPFGFKGTLALITLDNGHDHNRPNTFGPQSLMDSMPRLQMLPHVNQQQSL